MNNDHRHLNAGANLEQTRLECPAPVGIISPLGWSIKVRLLFAVAALACFWLAVIWALGWL